MRSSLSVIVLCFIIVGCAGSLPDRGPGRNACEPDGKRECLSRVTNCFFKTSACDVGVDLNYDGRIDNVDWRMCLAGLEDEWQPRVDKVSDYRVDADACLGCCLGNNSNQAG